MPTPSVSSPSGSSPSGASPSAAFGDRSEMLFFAVTPPRSATAPERVAEIADVTLKRLAPLGLDALVLYDIDDESDRNAEERPFPFLPTLDPAHYLDSYLDSWAGPAVVYRTVGKYSTDELGDWVAAQDAGRVASVFVGSSSRDKAVATSLSGAHAVRAERAPSLQLGAVAIPERHVRRADEHQRMLAKQEAGCSFFVTQVVYDVNAAKDLVSDYHVACAARSVSPVPVVFTLTVVGSLKTLAFLQWLGVDVPRWVCNDLEQSDEPLPVSLEHALATADELIRYCRARGMPFGLNVESVSNRRVEVDTAVQLAALLRTRLDRPEAVRPG